MKAGNPVFEADALKLQDCPKQIKIADCIDDGQLCFFPI